jgi:hypothetical protein
MNGLETSELLKIDTVGRKHARTATLFSLFTRCGVEFSTPDLYPWIQDGAHGMA